MSLKPKTKILCAKMLLKVELLFSFKDEAVSFCL